MSKWLLRNEDVEYTYSITGSFASTPVELENDGNKTVYGTIDNPYEKIKFSGSNSYAYYWHPDRCSENNFKEVELTSDELKSSSRLFRILTDFFIYIDSSYATFYDGALLSGSFVYDETKSSLPEDFPKRIFIEVKFKATLKDAEEKKYIGFKITNDAIYFIDENLQPDIAASINELTLSNVKIKNINFHIKEQEVPTFFADLFLTTEKKIFISNEQFIQRKNVILTQEINGNQVAVFPKTYVSGLVNDDGTSWKEPEVNYKLKQNNLDNKNVLKNIRIKGEVFKTPSLMDTSEEISF